MKYLLQKKTERQDDLAAVLGTYDEYIDKEVEEETPLTTPEKANIIKMWTYSPFLLIIC